MPTARPTPRYGQTCARSPSMMSASCSPGMKLPMPKFWMENLYSPSAGKSCRATIPPRVPNGMPFEPVVLRGVAGRQVGRLGRRLPVADRHAGDPRRGGRVRLEQRRRDRQRSGDVVEAVRRVVGRQQRRRVDAQVEQIADRVRVLGAVQSMQDDGARIGVAAGAAIDLVLEPVAQPFVLAERRPRHVRRRHHAGAQLADHLLPQLRRDRRPSSGRAPAARDWLFWCGRCDRSRSSDPAAHAVYPATRSKAPGSAREPVERRAPPPWMWASTPSSLMVRESRTASSWSRPPRRPTGRRYSRSTAIAELRRP